MRNSIPKIQNNFFTTLRKLSNQLIQYAVLNSYCDKLFNLWHKPIEEFEEWKTLIIEQVQIQLQGAKPYPYYAVLSDIEVLADLHKLHKEFASVPTDKAKNNITIVCK